MVLFVVCKHVLVGRCVSFVVDIGEAFLLWELGTKKGVSGTISGPFAKII